ncbi:MULTISPECIES: hypothetical protein [Haloferax]|uniref:Uncharacterized protein n=2 Tax=Haloferax TaxID=2251 RepID=A0A6G1Z792_9EURY|nr:MULTISPECIES: hypothetical protein [Haloferax]KAB1184808.1 hypothetical protein Hfx1149_17245 [Haloferax sp. CBA1149]MRW82439.1 hypothetical protein [Haloferax marinisediminis]
MFAVEVKGAEDIDTGLGQATIYRDGAHYSYLAAPATELNHLSKDNGVIGFLGVNPAGEVSQYDPDAQIKESLYDVETRLKSYFEGNVTNGNISGLQLSQPLNYLAPVLVMDELKTADKADIVDELADERKYDFHEGGASVSGAIELGLLNRNDHSLTDRGKIAVTFLGGKDIVTLQNLDSLKDRIPQGGALCESHPTVALFIRDLFRRHPDFELLYEAIGSFNQAHVVLPDVLERLVTRYPNAFLNLLCRPGKQSQAIRYLESEDRAQIYQDEDVWKSLIRQNVVHNFTHQLKHLGVLMPRTTAHPGSLEEYDPMEHPWWLEYDHGFW